jgi:hypothetical protein
MHNPYRIGVNRFYIAEQAIAGKSKSETFAALRPMVESQTLVFKRNPTREEKATGLTHRIPLETTAAQLTSLQDEIGRVYKELGLSIGRKFEDEETPAPMPAPLLAPLEDPTPEIEPEEDEIEEEEEEPELTPIAKGKRKIIDEMLYFRKRVREIRAKCLDRERLAESIDWISMRPIQAASKLIPAGIPADALLHTMTLHWSQDTRRDFGIADYDMSALSRSIASERGITEIIRKDENGDEYSEVPHEMFGYVLVLAENRIPILLVGEFGTSKSHLCAQLMDFLGLDYSETPMSLGATRGDLLGRFTANPDQAFIAAKFGEMYGSGGGFNFEEFDASDPGMLIVLNNAIAGKRFYNSNSGEMVDRSPDFIAMATANTFGYGATRRYTARTHIDEATLDRWRMGRVMVGIDERVEDSILFSGVDFSPNN